MPRCDNCQTYLDSEDAIVQHVEQVHHVKCRLGKPHEAYCETCHVYCGKKHHSTSIVVLSKHLNKKHDIMIQGSDAVQSDNVVG